MKAKAFTLIELLVVLVICFIVFSVIVGSCGKYLTCTQFSGTITTNNMAVAGGAFSRSEAAFSRALCLKTEKNEEIIFSSTDRQFAAINVGDRVVVRVSKYMPWDIDKAGTYYNGRLIRKY